MSDREIDSDPPPADKQVWPGFQLPTTTSLYRHGFADLSVLRILMGWTRHRTAAFASRGARRALLRRGGPT